MILILALMILILQTVAAETDCPAWREESSFSDCLWPRNENGLMSGKPMMDTFLEKCKLRVDWGGQEIPDITDKYSIRMPPPCGKCAFRVKCKNRQRKDGCFPFEARKETCAEHAEACEMPFVPEWGNCRWNMLGGFMGQCVTNRPDIEDWKRDGYQKGEEFFPELNCLKGASGCRCCCHPNRPVKDGDNVVCQEIPNKAENDECPAFGEFNSWSECLWYPLTQVAKDVNEHCGLRDLVPNIDLDKMLQKRIEAEQNNPDRKKMLDKLPAEKCGYCSFRVRCRKRPHEGTCFGFDGDKRACGPEDCEGCAEPCEMDAIGLVDNDVVDDDVAAEIAGTCDYDKLIMAYLRKRAGPMLKMMGKSYWKKRGFAKLMKFLPMGKCVLPEGGERCKCCCHPYVPNDEGTECVLHKMCKMPEDMGIEWDTYQ